MLTTLLSRVDNTSGLVLSTLTIINSTFAYNHGTTVEQEATKYVASFGSSHQQQFGRGGAILVYFKDFSEKNTISVTDCYIMCN